MKATNRITLVALIFSSTIAPLQSAEIEEVFVTGHRTGTLLEDFIGSGSIIDKETLELIAPTHVQEVLATVPGVNFHRNSGQEYLPSVRSPVLTGAGACGSLLIAEDNVPLRPAGFCNVNELFEAHWQQAEQVEVIRGPSSALFGSNALHGVINVITPEPETVDNALSLEAGSLDYYRIGLSASNHNAAILFTGTTDQGYRDNYGVDEQKLSIKTRHLLSNVEVSTGLTAINLNQETAGFIVGTDAYKDDDIIETNPNPDAYRDAQAVRLWTKVENESDHARWQVTPYLRYSEMFFLQHFLPGTPLEENGQSSLGIQTAYVIEREHQQLTFGLDAEYVDGHLKQSQANPTQGSAFLMATIPTGLHYDYEVNATQIAPFFQWQSNITDQLTMTAGVRYEWMHYDYDNLMVDGRTRDDGTECGFGGCRYSRPSDRKDDFRNVSPNINMQYTFDTATRAYISLARGFRAPQAVELYRLQRDQQVTDLDAEQLDSFEVGFYWAQGSWQVNTALYTMKKDNVIYRNSDFFTIDSGETRHRGIELSLSKEFTDALSIDLTASRALHTYEHNDLESGITKGNLVDSAPKHFGNLTVNWQINRALFISAQWQHMGSYYTDPENNHDYSGHDLLNLKGRLVLNPKLTLSSRIINVTDRRYADRADFSGFSGDRYFPGSPRAFFIELDLDW